MRLSLTRFLFLTLCLLLISTFANAQGGGTTSSITGTVVDSTGGVIPGADVSVKNDATGGEFKTVTASNGTFSIPALGAGIYTATITVPNFKVGIYKDIRLEAGVPATIRVVLQVGGTTETVTVEAGAEMVQSQTANVAATMNVSQIVNLPTGSRSALEGVILSLPGISISGTDTREARVMGLPENMVNITIDGISAQDNYMKSTDGFFSRVRAGIDAMEQVTVSTATPGAESAGGGAVQVKFITRSGNNDYHGSLYDYIRNDAFDANTWFKNRDIVAPAGADPLTWKSPASINKLHQFGVRAGGPISLPKQVFGPLGFDGRDKAFFFFNYEESRQPLSVTSTNSLFTPEAQAGNFLWKDTAGVVRSVNLLNLAQTNGFVSTWDPTVQKMLADMAASTSQGSLKQGNDPLLQTLTFTLPDKSKWRYMTGRLDFNLTTKHRLEATWNHNKLFPISYDTTNSGPPRFPNSPNYRVQGSQRYNGSLALRSTLTSRLVNEFRSGMSGGPSLFNPNYTPNMYSGSVYNMDGYTIDISGPGIRNPWISSSGSRRNATTKVLDDSLTWSKGSHSFSFGGAFTQYGVWYTSLQTLQTPPVTLGIDNSYDPARVMFDSTNGPKNFTNASNSQLSTARSMYGVLIGSVTQLGGSIYLSDQTNKYTYQGNLVNRGHYREYGFYFQDAWRLRPGLTVNYGIRWEFQRPFVPGNSVYSTATIADIWGVSGVGNMYKPGVMTGKEPQFVQYKEGTFAYNARWKDFAPSLGIAWTPNSDNKWLKKILGETGNTVIRTGYSIAYSRMGMATYLDLLGGNPGQSLSATRNSSNGNFITGVGTDQWPMLFRERSRLVPPSGLPTEPTFPMTSATYPDTSSMTVFEPNLRTPYAQSWQLGIQRELSRSMALEVRYVGTRSLQAWVGYNFNSNENNMLQNGLFEEFKLAMTNLQANVANGKASSGFKYLGPGTGTSPLPIALAYLNGLPASYASDPTKYTGSNWTNTGALNALNRNNPNPCCSTSSSNPSYSYFLYSDAPKRANGRAAGMPANFFMVNPNLRGGATVEGNGGYSQYDSLVIEVRRRMSKGLLVQANYTFAKAFGGSRISFQRDRINDISTGTLPHTFKLNWVLELPVGKGRKFFGTSGKLLDGLLGGWDLHGIFRYQSGDWQDFGNVRLVGMTDAELQSVYQLRFDNVNRQIYQLPDDIIQNTIKAYSLSATSSTGYSGAAPTGRYFAPPRSAGCLSVFADDCAPRHHYVRGANWDNLDVSLVKQIRFTEYKSFEIRGEFLNAFNEVNFDYTTSCISSDLNTCRVTGTQGSPRRIQLVVRLNF